MKAISWVLLVSHLPESLPGLEWERQNPVKVEGKSSRHLEEVESAVCLLRGKYWGGNCVTSVGRSATTLSLSHRHTHIRIPYPHPFSLVLFTFISLFLSLPATISHSLPRFSLSIFSSTCSLSLSICLFILSPLPIYLSIYYLSLYFSIYLSILSLSL